MTSETDPAGNDTDYTYSVRNWLTKITLPDPDGAGSLGRPEIEYFHDAAGRRTGVDDPLNNRTSFAYDDAGRLETVTLPDPDGAGSLTASVTTYAYDGAGMSPPLPTR